MAARWPRDHRPIALGRQPPRAGADLQSLFVVPEPSRQLLSPLVPPVQVPLLMSQLPPVPHHGPDLNLGVPRLNSMQTLQPWTFFACWNCRILLSTDQSP
jgi:hypothetical protein